MHEIDIDGIKINSFHSVYIPKNKIAVVADLHIGYEGMLQREGVMIPKYQKKILKERLKKIIDFYEPSKLIINGDLKHEFGKNLRQEWREVTEILNFIKEKTDVLLIRGNHDNYLKTIASKMGIDFVEEFEMENIKISHGHKNVDFEGKKLIMAHEHPSLVIRDKVGAFIKLPCFMVSEKIVVMPALSPLASGTDISSDVSCLSPILKKENLDDFRIYAINENELLYFSNIRKLKKVI
ncbi:MAG TPA: metallophosphoesterase [Thermoplasmatales archaeon]|nr:metallophosphoesterase [Thermoplasmatales archaeon]